MAGNSVETTVATILALLDFSSVLSSCWPSFYLESKRPEPHPCSASDRDSVRFFERSLEPRTRRRERRQTHRGTLPSRCRCPEFSRILDLRHQRSSRDLVPQSTASRRDAAILLPFLGDLLVCKRRRRRCESSNPSYDRRPTTSACQRAS